MSNPQQLITTTTKDGGSVDHAGAIIDQLDIWTAAIKKRGSQGRGSSKKIELHGIKKLRELILELAVRGLLVPQNPNDEPASVLLEKVIEEKSFIANDRKIREEKNNFEIKQLFENPKTWCWVPIGSIAHVLGGKRVPKGYRLQDERTEHAYIRVTDMKNMSVDIDHLKFIDNDVFEQISKYVINKEDVYVTIAGTIGAAGTIPNELDGMNLTENSAKLVFKGIDKVYLTYLLNSKYVQNQFKEAVNQMAQPKLSLNSIKKTSIVLAPEAEQPRIVAKVDELMALCDQLEQQTESSLAAHQTLVETLLNSLLDAAQTYPGHASRLNDDGKTHKGKTSRDPFQQAWQRIWENFDVLFVTEHSIDQLKQTILQLAVMGKLVPQDPNDEPASVLLEKIAAEKEQLIKDGKIKKQKPLPEISEDEKPFALPKGWEWIRFGNIYELEYGNNLPKGNRSNSGEYPVYGSNGIVGTHNEACVTNPCIVVGRKGSAGALNLNNSNGCWVTDVAYSVTPPKDLLLSYVYLMFHTLKLDELGKGIKPGLSRNEAYQLATALPPEAEQPRIVAKVDELMALCDTLKERIRESQTTQLHLADAMAEQALN